MEEQMKKALQMHGANHVAKVLGLSREACMSLALGLASNGTRAIAAQNAGKLDALVGR